MAKKQAPKPAKGDPDSKLVNSKSEPKLAQAEPESKLAHPATAPNLTKATSKSKSAKSEPKLVQAAAESKHPRPESEMQIDPLRFAQPKKQHSPEERQMLVAESAYSRAASRSFEPGHEVEDWLAAEAEVDRRLSAP